MNGQDNVGTRLNPPVVVKDVYEGSSNIQLSGELKYYNDCEHEFYYFTTTLLQDRSKCTVKNGVFNRISRNDSMGKKEKIVF